MNNFCKYILTLLVSISFVSSLNVDRINGKNIAKPEDFPSFVTIIISAYKQYYCGAAIIRNNYVLTSARCMENALPEDYSILAGTSDLTVGGTVYNIAEIKVHPSFDRYNLNNDLALIKISGQFQLNNYVQIAQISDAPKGEICSVPRWNGNDPKLQFINVTVLSSEECTKDDGWDSRTRGDGQVCAYGGVGVGICGDDWGSPLMTNGKIAGIVSYPIINCALGFPDVYTKASYYLDWIDENTY